ncbi:bifunctional diguanylate cyclase/phosphodiesterase [Niallia sp. 03133]|uniref:bifunctional diguanylate cyclase/phosphodiesterase n=1 Tax=Niallia sp. 03133 TaxID=3458060 RepID=UPI0040444C38
MFSFPDVNQVIFLEGHYSIPIVILSLLIACLASFTALSMHERMKSNSFFPRYVWLTLASLCMGFGIWSMHFIGMCAYMLPIKMEYNKLLTMLSVLPAMIASFLAFYTSSLPKQSMKTYSISGIMMGLGISSMHYIGMKAMMMDAEYVYHFGYFILSIFIAITVSFASLYIFGRLHVYMVNFFYKCMAAILMGSAIASMHYTGMHAVKYYIASTVNIDEKHFHQMNMTFFSTVVAAGIIMMLISAIISSIMDRYVDYRLNYFDALTKLPNRRQFEKTLKINSFSKRLAILHLHEMEKWNSMYGYSFGDKVIQYISLLCERLKPIGVELYRIEGNRIVFIGNKESWKELLVELRNISTILSNPIAINEQLVIVKTAIAISEFCEKNNGKTMYDQALAVLSHPSTVYEHTIIAFDPAVHFQSVEYQVLQDIDAAMAENDLYIVYQPKIAVCNEKMVGVEALLRWNHPIYGFLSPGIFIPELEKNGKMMDVTDWVVNEVCKQIIAWKEAGMEMQVSVNIPGPYVTSSRLLSVLKQSIQYYGIKPELLELEMTETSAVSNIEGAIQSVEKFRSCGFSVALDDFGTGVSSLSYLKRLPVTTLKIDKSFVDGVPESQKDSEIMKAIISLGHSLELNIVIEGVESKEQVDFLTSISGCEMIQGYYYAKPMKAEDLEGWVRCKEVEMQNV